MEAQILEMITKLGVEVGLPILLREIEKLGGRDAVLVALDALREKHMEQVKADIAEKHAKDDGA